MIQVFSQLKPSLSPSTRGSSSRACVAGKGQPGFSRVCGTTWGSYLGGRTQSQGGLNLVPGHPHLLRADLAKPWHLKDEEQVLSWPRILMGTGKDTQGQSLQAIAPCPLLPPTPRTHFPSLAALGPLHPQPCWWMMARTFPSGAGGPLSPYCRAVSPLCHIEPINCPFCGERCLDPGTQHRNIRAPAPHPQRNN